MRQNRRCLNVILAVFFGFFLVLDQVTKYLSVHHLKGKASIDLIPGFFGFTYGENTGAAWGQFEGMRWFLVGITAVLIAIMCWVLFSPKYRIYRTVQWSCVLVITGGLGNMIDRILQGYVVDFIHFKAIDFPIFNVADCCVVIGAVLLLIFFFFVYKEPEQTTKEDVQNETANVADVTGTSREED